MSLEQQRERARAAGWTQDEDGDWCDVDGILCASAAYGEWEYRGGPHRLWESPPNANEETALRLVLDLHCVPPAGDIPDDPRRRWKVEDDRSERLQGIAERIREVIAEADADGWRTEAPPDPRLDAVFERERPGCGDRLVAEFFIDNANDCNMVIARVELLANAAPWLSALLAENARLKRIEEAATILLSHLDHISMTREEDELMDNLRSALEAK